MNLFARALHSEGFDDVFSDAALVRAMLTFEVQLARSQAALGMISQSSAQIIQSAAHSLNLDADSLARAGAHAGVLAVALIDALREQVRTLDAAAATHVHFGATSQDVMDSAMALRTQVAVERIDEQLREAMQASAALARQHRALPMLARTLMQAAGITTFGYKAALWHSALCIARTRLRESAAQGLALSLGGPLGNLAVYGEHGTALRAHLASNLALRDPGQCWHTDRQDWIALAASCALAGGTLAKIAQDISLMAQSEVGEVSEPIAQGRGRSSALPHKRNPVLSMRILAAAQPLPGFITSLLSAMPQTHERALGPWQAELALWPQVLRHTYDAAQSAAELLHGLCVHPDRCQTQINAMAATLQLNAEEIAQAAQHSARQVDSLLAR